MVQIVENWADITGIPVEAGRDPAVPNHAHVRLSLTGAEDVNGFPNLFRSRLGEVIDLMLSDGAGTLVMKPGARIAVRARMAAPDRAFGTGRVLST